MPLLSLPARWEGMKGDGDIPQKQLPSLKQYRNMQAQSDPGLLQAPIEIGSFWLQKLCYGIFCSSSAFFFSSQKVFNEHIYGFRCFIKAVEFTNVGYLQRDLTEINMAALHSSHKLAVIHQMDEHHYRKKKTKQPKTNQKNHSWYVKFIQQNPKMTKLFWMG